MRRPRLSVPFLLAFLPSLSNYWEVNGTPICEKFLFLFFLFRSSSMLQWEWPVEWDEDFIKQLRMKVEHALVRAMSSNNQIGGRVEVSDVHLGRTPPEIRVNSIQDISCARTCITLGVKYQGEASIALRGLRINVGEMCSVKMPGTLGEDDANHALPLHLPFGVKIHHIHIEGEVALEFDQVVVERDDFVDSTPRLPSHAAGTTPTAGSSSCLGGRTRSDAGGASRQTSGGRGLKPNAGSALPSEGVMPGSSSATGRGDSEGAVTSPPTRNRSSAGCGIIFPSGGMKNMRQPETEGAGSGDRGRPVAGAGGGVDGQLHKSGAGGGTSTNGSRFCFFDVASGRAQVKSRTLRLQFFGDPLKNFAVESNLDTMKGTREKVEGTLKKLVRPAIEALMMNGVEFKL